MKVGINIFTQKLLFLSLKKKKYWYVWYIVITKRFSWKWTVWSQLCTSLVITKFISLKSYWWWTFQLSYCIVEIQNAVTQKSILQSHLWGAECFVKLFSYSSGETNYWSFIPKNLKSLTVAFKERAYLTCGWIAGWSTNSYNFSIGALKRDIS